MVTVSLSWTDNSSGENGFRVYRSTAASPTFPDDYSQIASLAADTTTYDDTSAPADAYLTYAVTAYNDVGESDASVSSTFYVVPQTTVTDTETATSATVRAPKVISGTVTDAGDPVEGAVVTAVKQDADADLSTTPSSADALTVQTEADGTYEFEYTELFAGVNTYHVIAHADDPERNGDVTYAYVQAGGAV